MLYLKCWYRKVSYALRAAVACVFVVATPLLTFCVADDVTPAPDKANHKSSANRDASSREQIATRLSDSILDESSTHQQLIAFTDARIARMPKVESKAAWRHYAERLRRRVLDEIVFRGEAAKWRDAAVSVEWDEKIPGGPGYHIRKLRYEALPGLWIPALLYEPDELESNVPVVLNVNGHDVNGKAAEYKQIRCINQAKRGMIALNVEWLGMGQLPGPGFNHYCSNQIDLCGTSGLAPFYLAMKRALDLLIAQPHADLKRVAVAGLSGGGWQTIVISSLDTRVTLCNPVAGYSSFRTRCRQPSDLGDSEQTPVDLASLVDYTHLTAMLAPRTALLTYNHLDNCCFKAGGALPPLLDAAVPIYELFGKPLNLRWHVNYHPGDHNFGPDNRQALYRVLDDVFRPAGGTWQGNEIESSAEVRTAEELNVPLPAENLDFHILALRLSKDLPHEAEPPEDPQQRAAWIDQRRAKLASIVRLPRYEVTSAADTEASNGDVAVKLWQLQLGDDWTIPAIEFTPADAENTAIVLADDGRKSTSELVAELLSTGHRVLAVDPLYFGESEVSQRPHLYCLLLSSIGERLLGVQAGQLGAVARWLKTRQPGKSLQIVARGRRATTAALVAAATEAAIDRLSLDESLGSLKEVIEKNETVENAPGLLCAGLLEHFDVPDIAALVKDRKVIARYTTLHDEEELAERRD